MPRGRPSASTSIVDPDDVLAEDTIIGEYWTLVGLSTCLKEDDPLPCLKWLACRNLVRNCMHCTTCNADCSLHSYSQGIDKYRWYCKACRQRTSVRKCSLFEQSHLPLWKIIIMMYCWCRDMPQKDVLHEAKLNSHPNTAIVWKSFFRDVCEEWIIQNSSKIGGSNDSGVPLDVDIDESDFFHQKYRNGQWCEGHWVFIGLERATGKCFMVEVPDRTATTLEGVITRFILPGSRIISDCLRSYSNLDHIKGGIYVHDIVNHSLNPHDNSVHTQNIESVWMQMKRKFQHQKGASDVLFPSYLAELLWRNANTDKDLFSAFVLAVSQQCRLKQERLIDHITKTTHIGGITDCNLKYTRDGVFRRFAFVGFNTEEEAASAQTQLHGTFIKTTKIQADVAKDMGDANVKAWSKYSILDILKNGSQAKKEVENEIKKRVQGNNAVPSSSVDADKSLEVTASGKSAFVIKMRGLTGFYSEKTIKEFFKPLKTSDVRIPKNAQKKPIGVAFVEFSKEKDLDQAMGRNKNFINGKKVFLKKSNEVLEKAKPISPAPWELKEKEGSHHEVESIGDSGRLFVRNLWFGVTEEELETVFGKFGPLAEITLPVDSLTKKIKGFAHVVYVFPEHAVKAYASLDYTSLHGRLMHILPGRDFSTEEESNEKSSYKKKKDQQNKANSSSTYNWNSLFLGANAVADAMADRYNTDKSQILDDESRGSIGVRMALGETQIVSETRQFLISNGVALDSFSQAAGQRSKNVILVKNLPSGVTTEELKSVFGKHGTVLRLVMPPSGITAIVEYMDSSEAKRGFAKLNFSKFRSIPLYLEWAPMGIFTKSSDLDPARKVMEEEKEMRGEQGKDKDADEDGSKDGKATPAEEDDDAQKKGGEETKDTQVVAEDDATLFVKNLNFDTTDESLKEHFSLMATVQSASVAKKKDSRRPGELLSMGYGFVQFMRKKDAKEALKNLQNSVLDGHHLELKLSTRTTREIQGRKKQSETKQNSTKILVRNIPFEAKKKEIEELFKVFGDLKFVRLPKKLKGTGPHRGFAFVDFQTKQDAKRAFDALCHSTHLFGRRLVLEWAEAEDSVEDLRRKTAQHFSDDGPQRKVSKKSIMKELE